jgi:hypothetical protein
MGTLMGTLCAWQKNYEEKGGNIFEVLWAFQKKHISQTQNPHIGFQLSILTEKQGSAEIGNL